MKKFLSLVLALVMTMSLVTISAGAKDFTDNSKITYKEAVDVVSALKIVDGYEDGAFNPTNNLTRGAAAKIICNLILGPTTASALSADTAPFKDVPTTNNFAGYIAYCAQQGIISGYADGTFRPAAPLTGYAFMKMLLGALGYDAAKEGYTGANWSVQVGKQALGVGLDDGNDEFVGTEPVNREEACLYAFNTLQATMVEYENQSQIVIGDITVNTSSKYKDMENSGKTDSNIDKNGKMEFAEKYFTDLKLKNGEDDFARPANVWTLKAEEIGTYAKTADASYTAKVEVGDIYKDLGLSSTVDKADVEVYEDGKEIVSGDSNVPVAIKKGDDDNKFGANGVLTEVFYDDDDGTVTITLVNTYVGKVNKTVDATSKKDAYVEINTEDPAPKSASGTEKFETEEEFEDDAYVLYTYSQSAEEIKSVKVAESVEGTATKLVSGKSLNLDDTTYKYSAKYAVDGGEANLTAKSDYTVYLDEYGYAIYVEEQEFVSSDYALVLALEGSSSGKFTTNRAKLLFADGTEKVVDTEKDYGGKIDELSIVTYKVNDDKEYTLKEVTANGGTKSVADSSSFEMKNGTAKITAEDDTTVYSNSKTVFVVKDGDDYNAYTGTTNAPSVKATTQVNHQVSAYWYAKTSNMASIMFVLPESGVVIETGKNDILFLAGESASKLIRTNDGDYYEYNAVVNGEIKTVMVDDGIKNASNLGNSLYRSASYDKDGIITNLNAYTTKTSADKYAGSATGTAKKSGEYTVTLGNETDGKESFTVADDAKIFEVNTDGDITAGSISSVTKDENDVAYYIVDDGQITYLFLQEVKDDEEVEEELSKDVKVRDIALGDPTTITYYVESGKKALSNSDINAILKENGCTDISLKGGKWSFTDKGGLTYTEAEVKTTQVYKVTVDKKDPVYLEATKTVKDGGTLATLTGKFSTADGGKNFEVNTTGFTVADKDLTITSGYYEVEVNSAETVTDVTGSVISYTVNGDEATNAKKVYVKDGAEIVVIVKLGDTGLTTSVQNAKLAVTGSKAAIDTMATLGEGAEAEAVGKDTDANAIIFPTSSKLYKGGIYTFTLTVSADNVAAAATAVTLTNV